MNGDFMFTVMVTGAGPKLVGGITGTIGGGDDAQEFLAAGEGIGNRGIKSAPKSFRGFVKCEFIEHDITAVTADGARVRRQGNDPGAIGPANFRLAEEGTRGSAVFGIVRKSKIISGGPEFHLLQKLDRLTFAGTDDEPLPVFCAETIVDNLDRAGR